jgi:hypothetical protein
MIPERRSPSRRYLPAFFALSGLLGLLSCDHAGRSPSEALGPAFAQVGTGGTTLDLHPQARLLADETVRILVEVGCPEGLVVLEAFVTVSQATAFGTAPIPADCTGRTRKHRLIVTALEGSFEPGPAVVSGFLLVVDPTTSATEQGQDTETVELR